MSRIKSTEEMSAIQAKDAELRSRQEIIPEKNEAKPVAFFEVERYTKGPFMGLFLVHQIILEDGRGKPLRQPLRKVLAEGVDMVVAMSSLETALRRKVFK